LFPIGRVLYPNGFCTLKELGLEMINVMNEDYNNKIITGKDIIKLAKGV